MNPPTHRNTPDTGTVDQSERRPEERRNVFLIEPDDTVRENLTQQITPFGYRVYPFADLEKALERAREVTPDVVILDVFFVLGEFAITLTEILDIAEEPPPLMYLSDQGDFGARLQSVRFGGKAFFTRPVDIGNLIGELDRLTNQETIEPYRVLIVEYNRGQAEYLASILQRARMETRTITNPLEVLSELRQFNPELLLMNLYYPGCPGMELAAVIRMEEAYHGIPIVFLTREMCQDRRMAALQRGGDDFLMQPVESEQLISSVSFRVERTRSLRRIMLEDNLTGLYHHTALMDRFTELLDEARESCQPLSLGMIDLDHFRQLNDNYGHAAGDGVIKNLARLLRRRMRQTDVLGRMGGEELAVVMPATDLIQGRDTLDSIRRDFEKIRHYSSRGEFNATFSCGVASFPVCDSLARLSASADRALYRAKEIGRNSVVAADAP